MSGRADPDRILTARLHGSAIRLARAGGRIGDAIAELRELAGGRGDLLAETAGIMGGYWSAAPEGQTGDYVVAFGLLMLAGADHDQIAAWVDVGRKRATASRHSV